MVDASIGRFYFDGTTVEPIATTEFITFDEIETNKRQGIPWITNRLSHPAVGSFVKFTIIYAVHFSYLVLR